jgi:hypothetical protein
MSTFRAEFTIAPPNASKLERSQVNRDLYEAIGRRLRAAGYNREAEELQLVSDDKSAMDFGATIIAILATPAVVALAKGIANYLVKLAPSKRIIVIKDGKKSVKLVNPTEQELTQAFQSFHAI